MHTRPERLQQNAWIVDRRAILFCHEGDREKALTMTQAEVVARSGAFRRAENQLAHTVYGLLLTVATLGELLNHGTEAVDAIGWLLGTGVVLLAAHLFSDGLAHLAAVRSDPDWSYVKSIGKEEASVTFGAFGAAIVMAVTAAFDLDSATSLVSCIGLGVAVVAWITVYATVGHRWWHRGLAALSSVVLSGLIVILENTV